MAKDLDKPDQEIVSTLHGSGNALRPEGNCGSGSGASLLLSVTRDATGSPGISTEQTKSVSQHAYNILEMRVRPTLQQ